MRTRVSAAVALAALLLLAGCTGGVSAPAQQASQAQNEDQIAVAASGQASAEPNQVVVRVAVVSTAPDAVAARQRLAENATRMRTALTEMGLDDDQITTRRYDLDRDYRRPPKEGQEPEIQYRGYHAFEITLSDLDRVGTVIDTAVRNGATQVDDVEFTLTEERRRELRRTALQRAMTNARGEASAIATEANLTVTGVHTVRTADSGGRRYVSMATETAVPQAAGADTDIESGPVTVTTTVEVTYSADG